MAGQLIQCPLCGDQVDQLVYRFHFDSEQEVIEKIKREHNDWVEQSGACSRCVDYYHTEAVLHKRILPEAGPFFPIKSVDDFIILPTPLRVNADPHFTGKGITICIIDSGFFLHDDLIATRNRVKALVDITNPDNGHDYFLHPNPESWHGTMTSVVCAGDGYKSNGLYKGIASDADLVLIKVQVTNDKHPDHGRITSEHIAAAMQWVLDHHKEFDIRVVSMSLGEDKPSTHRESKVSQLAEKLIADGVVVVAAAGNDVQAPLKPPASSPNVITVGGLDDSNNLEHIRRLYHSSFGQTPDGLMKPELIAPAIWVAAPILPETKEKCEAEWLHTLLGFGEAELAEFTSAHRSEIKSATGIDFDGTFSLRNKLVERVQATKFISSSYMHVDGTSFAAPIVAAVVAQLLQANPSLTPFDIRNLLFRTAQRLPEHEAVRQGFGQVHPRRALVQIQKRETIDLPGQSPRVDYENKKIEFYIQHEGPYQITLSGDFNQWAKEMIFFSPGKDGRWKAEIPLLPAGRYRYKFLINEHHWMEDVSNPLREPDTFNGFNSVLEIK